MIEEIDLVPAAVSEAGGDGKEDEMNRKEDQWEQQGPRQ